MPRSRVYKCSTCGRSHPKPTGKHCQWPMEDQGDPQPEAADCIATLTQAIAKLTEKMDNFGDRLATVEKGSDDGDSSAPEEGLEDRGERLQSQVSPQRTDPDVPSVQDLRRDYAIGREVNRRLAEMGLQDDDDDMARAVSHRKRGKRSGVARTVQDSVVNDIDWPHFHIYTQPGAEPMTFERLTIPEFVYGYLHMVDQPGAKLDRRVMWDLLKDMMEDATEYPWPNVRNFFWIVGSHVENDRMKWTDTENIRHLRVKYAQKHEVVVKKAAITATQREKLRYCGPYQRGQCPEKADHPGQKHMCAFCYKTRSIAFQHPESECRRKTASEQPKNGKGGGSNRSPP